MHRLAVAVVGPGDDVADDLLAAAYDAGAALAAAGALVVTGGLGGVMAAACRGAVEAGGETLGFLPGADAAAANEWVTTAVPTGLGEGRNLLVVRAAAALVAVGGSWGTLSEVALALRAGRRVVAVGGWQVLDAHGVPVADGPVAATSGAEAARLALAVVRSPLGPGGRPGVAWGA